MTNSETAGYTPKLINETVSEDWLHNPRHAVIPSHAEIDGERKEGWICATCQISNLGPTYEAHIQIAYAMLAMIRAANRDAIGAR